MPLLETMALAVGLGMDAMSVCTAIGVRWHGPRQRFRLAWHMGLFQFFMPLLGWSLGSRLAELVRNVGSYLAAGLLFAIGAKMFYEAWRRRPGHLAESSERLAQSALQATSRDPTRGWSLLGLSLATSIDALAAGVSLGLKGRGIWAASLVIGVVAGAMALLGVMVGRRIGRSAGRPAEFAGAVVLMVLGVWFLWS